MGRQKNNQPEEGAEYISGDSTSHKDEVAHGGHESHGDGHRPRNLGVRESLFHLDADWGTSLAYILPLSLGLTGRLAPIYMIIIAVIMFIVANGYKIVCRHNPDGGGVYSSLKKVNQFLAVVGALLLITDYIVTEALSISDSFHYLHIDELFKPGAALGFLHDMLANPDVSARVWTIIIIIFLAIINWKGPHFSAKFAGIASASTFVLAGILALLAFPLIPQGLANIGQFNQSIFEVLRNTVGVLLALSGVEAISNMTGIMKNPERTSKKTLNLELVKVIGTTVILGIAMNALPLQVTYATTVNETGETVILKEEREQLDLNCVVNTVGAKLKNEEYECPKIEIGKARPDMLIAMGEYLGQQYLPSLPQAGTIYGLLIGLAYGLLLIFAGNTALIGITNVTYSLAEDGELPKGFTKLNKNYGVPIWGLVTAAIAPIVIVLIVGANVEALAALYAIGVVGAVSLNLAGTTIQVEGRERIITGIGAVVMTTLFITLVVNKMEATIFAAIVLFIGLSARALEKFIAKKFHHSEANIAL